MDFEAIGWVKSSKYRKEILNAINPEPLTPKEIAEKINLNISNVSSYLGPLAKKGLVICLNEGLRKGRMYDLSKKGKEIIKHI